MMTPCVPLVLARQGIAHVVQQRAGQDNEKGVAQVARAGPYDVRRVAGLRQQLQQLHRGRGRHVRMNRAVIGEAQLGDRVVVGHLHRALASTSLHSRACILLALDWPANSASKVCSAASATASYSGAAARCT
jgi:hypothetical protein